MREFSIEGSSDGSNFSGSNCLGVTLHPLVRRRRFPPTNRNHGWLSDIQYTRLHVFEMLFDFVFGGDAVLQEVASDHAYRRDLQRDALGHGDWEVRLGRKIDHARVAKHSRKPSSKRNVCSPARQQRPEALPDPVGQFLFGAVRIDATQRLKRGVGIFQHQPTARFQDGHHVPERTFPFRKVDQYEAGVYQIKPFIGWRVLRNVVDAHFDGVGRGLFCPGSINIGRQYAACIANAFCNLAYQRGAASAHFPASPALAHATSIELPQ